MPRCRPSTTTTRGFLFGYRMLDSSNKTAVYSTTKYRTVCDGSSPPGWPAGRGGTGSGSALCLAARAAQMPRNSANSYGSARAAHQAVDRRGFVLVADRHTGEQHALRRQCEEAGEGLRIDRPAFLRAAVQQARLAQQQHHGLQVHAGVGPLRRPHAAVHAAEQRQRRAETRSCGRTAPAGRALVPRARCRGSGTCPRPPPALAVEAKPAQAGRYRTRRSPPALPPPRARA